MAGTPNRAYGQFPVSSYSPMTFSFFRRFALVGVALLSLAAAPPAADGEDFGKATARTAPRWLSDGVVYEIFTRNFSSDGNFNGITARLDDLKDLGVTVLWLMPIHPTGE